jgi:hypothetical protein
MGGCAGIILAHLAQQEQGFTEPRRLLQSLKEVPARLG